MSTGRCSVIVFAKAPVPGRVKTRLVQALGAEGAAVLAERFLVRMLTVALAADVGPVQLCIAGSARHAGVRRLADGAGVSLRPQGRGGLGRRMAAALDRQHAQTPHALLVGTDVPGLNAAMLRDAAARLDTHDAVFVPTADGGYALVGLSRPVPGLFDGMRWSHDRVMQDTRDRLRAAGAHWAELPIVHDVDTPEDLMHLPEAWR